MHIQEDDVHLLDYWKVLVKRRRIALLFFATVVSLVAIYSFLATPVYRGTAQILLELEKNPIMTFADGGGAFIQMKESSEYYRTQTDILVSRSFADRVVRKLQLDQNPYFLEKKESLGKSIRKTIWMLLVKAFPEKGKLVNPIPLASIQEELDSEITFMVLKDMDVEIGKGSNLLKISYSSDNPMIAAAMANGIAATYIEHNLDIRVKPFRDAVEWLSARMNESRSKVEESEKTVQKYKEGKGIVSFESKENVITQKLQELMTQLVQAESKRQETEVRYKQIASVVDNTDQLATVPDVMNNLVIQGLRTEELSIKRKVSELSEKYGPKHPQIIKAKTELDSVQKNLIIEARKMLSAARTDFEISRGREMSLRKTIEEQKNEVLDLGRKSIEYEIIAGEAVSNKQFYELLLKKLQEASLSSGIIATNAQIVDAAVIPGAADKPKKLLNILLAIFSGLVGGVFATFFVEYMDDTIKTPDDVERLLQLPFMGYVPTTNKEDGPLYMFSGPRASIAESYRTIRTSIMLSSADDEPRKVLLVTSTTPNEGKTTTAANLAVAMAQMGERVLLVDTDMRRHNLHKVFSLENLIGVSDMIIDPQNVPLGIRSVSQVPNLSIITGGTLAPNPSELLGSNRMKELISELRKQFDRIILDSPPLMAFSDCLVLSRLADGVLFIVWGGETSREGIMKTVQSLRSVGARMLGVVLNNVDLSKRSSYYYYHPYYDYYYYGAYNEKKDPERKKD